MRKTAEPLSSSGTLENGLELGSSNLVYGGIGGRHGWLASDPLSVDQLECFGQIRGQGEHSGGFNAGVRWKTGFGVHILPFILSIYAGIRVSPVVSILRNSVPSGCRSKWVLITDFNPGGSHSAPMPTPTKGSLSDSGYPDSFYGSIGGLSSLGTIRW